MGDVAVDIALGEVTAEIAVVPVMRAVVVVGIHPSRSGVDIRAAEQRR